MFRALIILIVALPPAAQAAQGPVPATVSACFTPGPASCAELIVNEIDAAKSKVRVQAYYLTSPTILHAIGAAKRRGLDVEVILDKSQDRRTSVRSRYTGATYLAKAGIPVWIDDAPSIAHNKVIILDDARVITGSFNFTRAADERNAENVVVLKSAEVAGWFARNWGRKKLWGKRPAFTPVLVNPQRRRYAAYPNVLNGRVAARRHLNLSLGFRPRA